jgi:hypothetical protein
VINLFKRRAQKSNWFLKDICGIFYLSIERVETLKIFHDWKKLYPIKIFKNGKNSFGRFY